MACNLGKGRRRSVYLTECVPLWGSASARGRRAEMEDAFAAVPRFADVPVRMLACAREMQALGLEVGHDAAEALRLPMHLFGVYDGHGGVEVANYCRDRIHVALREVLLSNKSMNKGSGDLHIDDHWEKVLSDCFQRVDDEVSGEASRFADGVNNKLQCKPVGEDQVGSTAAVALVCASHVIIANCGDSRVVLSRGKEPHATSMDHKPDRKDECARIEAAGGRVITWGIPRVSVVLAMSRSIGGRCVKPYVIPKPEVIVVPRAKDDDLLILASDGMWDVMSNEDACKAARVQILLWYKQNGNGADSDEGGDPTVKLAADRNGAAQAAADFLVKRALWNGSTDNITVTVIDLKPRRKIEVKSL